MHNKALNYDDVYLVPNKCTLNTRGDADTSLLLGGKKFKLPIIPANMKTTIDFNWSNYLDSQGYFYIMHRFEDQTLPFVDFAEKNNFNTVSISTGIAEQSRKEIETLSGRNIDYITIDIAHGHSDAVQRHIDFIKQKLPNTYIIAGNVATAEAVEFLERSGADAVKVGIGSGVICTTKLQTGFHVPMFTCIQDCAQGSKHTALIADGGIKHFGDIAKAIVAGADAVMAGGVFAGCSDSPAQVINGKKIYFGSTSFTAKQANNHIEGRTLSVEVETTLENKIHEITQSLQSSISYAGGNNLNCLKYGVKYYTTI